MIVKTSTSVVLSKFFDVALYAHVNIIFTTQMLPKTSLDLDRPQYGLDNSPRYLAEISNRIV